jgi:hypothetical protein
MPLYEFKCSAGHVTEHLVPSDVTDRPCSVTPCDDWSSRQFSSRFGIVGPTTDTRGMFRRYQEATAEIGHAADKMAASTGRDIEMPNLWTGAKQRAEAMTAAGENPYGVSLS